MNDSIPDILILTDPIDLMTQHGGLTLERWSRFTLDQQVLMIANEMNRTGRLLTHEASEARRRGCERILALTDLTVALSPRPQFRRELLRWRDLVAALYIADSVPDDHFRDVFRVLLRLRPVASRQIAILLAP